ncbi:MAG: hypothetical protein AB1817_22645 [Chloroflexota bacterium]
MHRFAKNPFHDFTDNQRLLNEIWDILREWDDPRSCARAMLAGVIDRSFRGKKRARAHEVLRSLPADGWEKQYAAEFGAPPPNNYWL